jgi:transposase
MVTLPRVRCTDVTARSAKQKLRCEVRRAKRRYHAALRKAKRVVRNFHYNVAHDLLRRHQTVILPTNTSHHWRKGKRLARCVKRRATLLQMGMFGERLMQTATWCPSSRIVRGSEAYTSKQCGRCGTLNDKLGGSEVFTCRAPGCGNQGDRDVHAARNILLRFLE